MTRSASQLLATIVATIALGLGSVAVAQTAPAAQAKCTDCGRVQSIQFIEEKGQSSGVGAVAGGVLGGVLGHQVGSGRGNTVATVAGAAGGAYVGNKVEQNKNAKAFWQVTLKMDGGATRTFTFSNQPTVKEGERVKLVDGGKRLALVTN